MDRNVILLQTSDVVGPSRPGSANLGAQAGWTSEGAVIAIAAALNAFAKVDIADEAMFRRLGRILISTPIDRLDCVSIATAVS